MKKAILSLIAVFFSIAVWANEEDSLAMEKALMKQVYDSINASMKYSTGTIKLPDGTIELKVPAGFKFLDAAQSQKVLTEFWGNPPSKETLGMIFPENGGPMTEGSYAFVVSYESIGYVKDEDADKINYDDLLKDLREGEKAENEERKKAGYEAIHMIGWASKPFYDKENKILHWAKELQFGTSTDHTLNYGVRILGRKGVLVLNAVATMDELNLVKADIPKVIHIANFTSGNTYSDFNPDVDEVAAWTIGGLVAGKILTKVGLWAVIAKFGKFIVLGIIAIGGWLFSRFRKKKEEQTEEYIQEAEAVPAVAEVAQAPETPQSPEAPQGGTDQK
ncbi:DUF2167 domain-containing protein [Pseudobacter ginsenosidimutans]|uniref:Putative membrane-anchored protein n=1 Tax=Pseudobacter ginsenosidimutans TaxID=661488 RepID=A0A4Q7MKM8_9BACT|nr:DUF2167 domain-containing protein [Pseudobacter ginsenosidimutans]QEC40441.1 DUF2167 domain-containing protein [Pseudobacter ginsenosidimutans]RZS68951.1 putative membrane-anchored protein [Pseudobacter ginsenosidimutans]